jgi:hypothetical protein
VKTEILQKSKTPAAPAPARARPKIIDLGFLSMKLPNALPRFAVLPVGTYDAEQAAWAVLRESGRVEVCRGGVAGDEDRGGLDMSQLPEEAFNVVRAVLDQLQRAGVGVMWDSFRLEVTLAQINRLQQSAPDRFREIVAGREADWRARQSITYTYHAAFPSSRMPAAIREQVSEALKTGAYGPVHVAWEASWQEVLKLTLAAGARPGADPLDPIAFARHKATGQYHVLGTWDLTKLESYVVAEFTE